MVKRLLLVASSCTVLLAQTTQTALAYHTQDDRQTDFSAFTLRRQQLRVGLFQQEYGIFNWWTVGTYTLPWLLIPIVKSFNMDLYTKFKFVDNGRWALSGRLSFFYLQYRNLTTPGLDDGNFSSAIVPLELSTSYVVSPNWTVSLQGTWVQTIISAEADTVDDNTTLGAGALSNLQFALNAEYRVSRVVALNLVTRYLPYARPARFRTDAQIDSSTQAKVDIEVDSKEVLHSWLIQPGVTFSWKVFNLQLGIGYGDLWIPGVRLVAARKFVVPDFDFYFRF